MAERYYLCVKFVTSKFKLYHTYTSSYFFLMFSLLLSRIAFDTLHAYYLTAYLHTFSLNTMRNIKPSSADSLQISFIDRELSRLGPFSSGVPTQGRLCSPQIIQSRFFFFLVFLLGSEKHRYYENSIAVDENTIRRGMIIVLEYIYQ